MFVQSNGIILLMAKKRKSTKKKQPVEKDSVFFMKIVFYFLLGAMWVRLLDFGANDVTISLPVGFIIGLFFVRHEHFAIDRKLEYVILFLAMVLSFYFPVGILV